MSTIIVDVNHTKKFTKENLETYERLVVPEAYPWIFGEDLLPSLKVVSKASLIEFNDVNWQQSSTEQSARAGGRNPKYDEISRDISTFGFKLSNPSIVLFRKDTGELIPLNGRTRKEILVHLGFTNFIAIILEAKDGATEEQIENDISAFGLLSNSYSDPSGDLQLEDVFREVSLAIKKKWITVTGKAEDTDSDLKSIRQRVDLVCGKGCFTPNKREQLVYRIHNTNNPQYVVKSWSSKGATSLWMKENNIKDIKPTDTKRGIKYICVAASTGEKSLISAANFAYENPDCEIRVIIHTGTLTGFDLEENYIHRVTVFRDFWDATLLKLSSGFFGGVPPKKIPIKLYGVLPALSSMHNLNKLVKFVTPNLENDMNFLEQSSDDSVKVLPNVEKAA